MIKLFGVKYASDDGRSNDDVDNDFCAWLSRIYNIFYFFGC